jgi:hypothetical protein
MDVIDLGVTWSSRPGFALYYDFVPVIPVGFGYVDGHFAGLGGGRFGAMRHFERSYGLVLWGQEEVGFGTFDRRKPETVRFQRTGLIGMVQGPFPGPDYLISCPHYFHLGWVGLVGTPRYLQMLDFVLGWTTLDIGFDDGRPIGAWPGRSPRRGRHAPRRRGVGKLGALPPVDFRSRLPDNGARGRAGRHGEAEELR